MTISDKDHVVLLKAIKGIKDGVDNMYTLGNDDTQYVRNDFLEYLMQLTESHKEEKIKAQ